MVYQQIKHVAMNFPIHPLRCGDDVGEEAHSTAPCYPRPGRGGDIAGRVPHSLDDETFHRLIPNEFWREVVDRINEELPDTLLLAEAFWMMEGYFVRTGNAPGVHGAFMNMLKNQENKKYRDTIKNTLTYEPEILKRFVNFMNNPDEETAIANVGDGDKYFGCAPSLQRCRAFRCSVTVRLRDSGKNTGWSIAGLTGTRRPINTSSMNTLPENLPSAEAPLPLQRCGVL